MKTVVILLLFLSPVCFSQADTMARHHACGQLGGQSFVSMHYEYSLIARKHFSLLTDVGVGINENADDTDYENHPAIYSVYHGLTGLFSINPFHLEVNVSPTSFLSTKTSYINLTGWFGVRFMPLDGGIYISLGYTPILYSTFSDVYNDHFDTFVGLKVGGSF